MIVSTNVNIESQQDRECLVAIPAYNEASFLKTMLEEISAYISVDHILVVNDGSTDATGDVARKTGVRVLEHPINRGKGAAIRSAMAYALQHRYPWLLFMDGDGQHPVQFVPRYLQRIRHNAADVILGHRAARSRSMPLHRQLSNGITSILVSLVAGGPRIYDSQCGFRALRVQSLQTLQLRQQGFQLESEVLIQLGRQGARFEQIPISTHYGAEHSSIHLIGDTLKFIKLIIKSLW